MNENVIRECTEGSFAGTIRFPEVVERLGAVGVERYTVDLTRLEKTAYDASGESFVEPLPLADAPPVADDFSAAGVQETLADVQQGRIGYSEFLRRIMAAGIASYGVFLGGRRALYVSRWGDVHVERFPDRT